MKTKLAIACLLAATLAACAPLNHDALRQHAERNCRVQAFVSPAYKVGANSVDTHDSAYAICMRSAGFRGE